MKRAVLLHFAPDTKNLHTIFVIDAGYNKRHVKHDTTHSSKSEPTADTMSRLQNTRMLTDTKLLFGVISNDMSNKSLDQARFNLATHVMSNGVELIIASDKIKHIDKQAPSTRSPSISLSSRHAQQKPVTFAPSTLKNHMILALPTIRQVKIYIYYDHSLLLVVFLRRNSQFQLKRINSLQRPV